MKKTLLFLVAGFFFLNNLPAQKPIEQKEIRLVQYMPNIPFPYKMKNWKDIATKQDRLFYDFNAKGQNLPLIWWDDSQVNFPFRTFGLPSYVDKRRLGGNSYESLPTMGSLISASLIGVDKSNDDGKDYVSMIRQFFNNQSYIERTRQESRRKFLVRDMAGNGLFDAGRFISSKNRDAGADEDHCRQLVCCYPGLK